MERKLTWTRSRARAWSSVSSDGLSPPCKQKICRARDIDGHNHGLYGAAHLASDKRCHRQVVEQVSEVVPDVGVAVFSQALIVEAVDLRSVWEAWNWMVTVQVNRGKHRLTYDRIIRQWRTCVIWRDS